MEIRSKEEVNAIILSNAIEILDYQIQKKALDEKISEVKQDAKQDGIAISTVMKMIAKVKREAKQSEEDKLEEDLIQEMLEKDNTIQDKIAELNA